MDPDTAQRRHLVSAYATVCHLLRQLEEAAREGRSPTGVGAPLTPLPDELTDALISPLTALAAALRSEASRLAPQELRELETTQSLPNTLVWASNLLDHIRETVDGLQPTKMRKYGHLTPDIRQAFSGLHERLSPLVRQSREVLDSHDQRSW